MAEESNVVDKLIPTVKYVLNPIGLYNDYSEQPNKTSYYMIEKDTMYLFDCPFSNVQWLMEKDTQKLLNKVKKVAIFITSMKESRIGGLKTFIDVLVAMGEDHMVYLPIPIWIQGSNYLELVGAELKDCHMMRGEYYQDDNIQVFSREVVHDGISNCFAYMIYGGDRFIDTDGKNWSVYYSPDNRAFMDDAVVQSFLEDPKEKTIYHCISLDIEDETHCYKDRITKAIPKKLRNHIYPINWNKPSDYSKFKTLGFNV